MSSSACRRRAAAFVSVAATCLLALPAGAEEWASIKGKFTFKGDAPKASELKADKDVEVCGKHKLLAEELVVGTDGGIANVVVYVRDKDVKVNPALAAKGPVTLDNKDCRFQPHVAFVQVGQEFIIKNSDTVGHNSNVATVKNSPSNTLIPAGGDAKSTFTSEEAIPAQVTCNIHPWMKAYAVFRKDGYVAVTAADGSFTIPDLPAGETIELQVWHERSTGPNGAVGLEKPELKWTPKGRFQIKLEPDEIKDLGTIEVPASAIGT